MQQHTENTALETQAQPWIVERSRRAAEAGAVWTEEDHAALVSVLRRIDGLVQGIVSSRSTK